MNPNDPNNQNPAGDPGAVLPKDPNAPAPEELTPEALYGPSTPGVDLSAPAATPPATDPMQAPADLGPLQVPESPMPAMGADPLAPQDPGLPPMDTGAPAMPNQDLSQMMPPVEGAAPTDMQDPTMGQELPQDAQPVPDASTFYQENQPTTDQIAEPYDQGATPGYEPYQPETEEVPQPGYEQPAPLPAEAPVESSGSNLPPIPKRSKLPILIMGLAVFLLIGAAAAYFVLGRGGGDAEPSPAPTEEPLTCEEDPENPDCIDVEPTEEPTDEPTFSIEPSSSGNFTIPPTTTPAPSTRPCELLGTC